MIRCAACVAAVLALPAAAGQLTAQPTVLSTAPFLWQVRGEHATPTTTHFLLGSIHMLPASAYPLPAALDRAYDHAQRLVFETDPAILEDAGARATLSAAARAERPMRELLPPRTYGEVGRQARRLGLADGVCDALRAWFCALTLEMSAFLRADFTPDRGIDAHFYARARAERKDVTWLEPPAEHLRLLTGIPDALGRALLDATLEELDDPREGPEQLLRAWRTDDVAAMAELGDELRREHPQAYARLIGERNRAWRAPLAARLRGDVPLLVIVGAAHWVGVDGLIDQLRSDGFEVAAVEDRP
ncbi:MAG: TraB/GumN family protein [Sinimarinibacterium sp.]